MNPYSAGRTRSSRRCGPGADSGDRVRCRQSTGWINEPQRETRMKGYKRTIAAAVVGLSWSAPRWYSHPRRRRQGRPRRKGHLQRPERLGAAPDLGLRWPEARARLQCRHRCELSVPLREQVRRVALDANGRRRLPGEAPVPAPCRGHLPRRLGRDQALGSPLLSLLIDGSARQAGGAASRPTG